MEISATVVGILSLGIQSTQGLIRIYTSANGQKADTAHMVSRLNELASILQAVHTNIRRRKFNPDEQKILGTIESVVRECEKNIRELHDEAKKFTESSSNSVGSFARMAARRLAYPFRESTLLKLDKVVDDLCSQLNLALQVLQLKDMTSIENDIRATEKAHNLIKSRQMSNDLREWLKAPDAAVHYNETIRERSPNTGNWLIKGQAFSNWLVKPNSFLWLNGFVGCGKSVLASTAIQHVLALQQSNRAVGVGYFYFTSNDHSKQSASSMLRSVILQLLGQLKVDNPAMGQLRRLKTAVNCATPQDSALLSVLRTLIRQFDKVYIILDALDESPRRTHRGNLLDTIHEIRGWSDSRLHLFATSWDEQDIRESLRPTSHEDIRMRNHSVDADIKTFITGYLQSSRPLQRLREFHPLIQEVLISKAEGSFRWVECHLDALARCPGSKSRVSSALSSLPKTLSDTYERMLLGIPREFIEDARKVLTLLCTATRPLTIAEFIKALTVELGPGMISSVEDILHICPGLLTIDQNRIRFVHNSLREYLQSEYISQSRASSFHVRGLPAQRNAIRTW